MKHLSRLLIMSLSLLCFSTMAAVEPKVSQLTSVDLQFMQDQRDSIDSLARTHFGQQLNGDKANDLYILQKLLDKKLVQASQQLELQAMGVVLGDLLLVELSMKWVVYEDKLGRSRALQMPASDYYLFPVTMISRRVEADAATDVKAVYEKACRITRPHMTKLPFQ
jgi:hypothetical protein